MESLVLFTRIYQCQGKPYGNCWMMLRVNVLRHPRGHLWRGIAASGPLHPQTDLYIFSLMLIIVNAHIYL